MSSSPGDAPPAVLLALALLALAFAICGAALRTNYRGFRDSTIAANRRSRPRSMTRSGSDEEWQRMYARIALVFLVGGSAMSVFLVTRFVQTL